MSAAADFDDNPDNVIKILIATDIHLGFEFNKKRGYELDDSYTTFEEILRYGRKHDVDFILLGGDLFHDTKPSQTAIMRCMELLRLYCLGSREIKVQFLSDPTVIFKHCTYKTVNYEDPNFNISMPIFSIHGNHDDPSFGAVGSMDILSASGLVNYFGKWTDLTKISIPPLIMKKGETTVALYGLSYINDQRLSRLMRDYKMDLLRPKDLHDCFNIFVLHQNRVIHGEYAHVPENKLPEFLHFVIWGHEHECRIKPEHIVDVPYHICQPGSSIATSLCEGEAKPKHVGILSVSKTTYKLEPLKLNTVRPFVFENLILRDQEIETDYTRPLSLSVYNFVDNYIENVLIPKAAKQLTGHSEQPIQPLLRLRIFYSSEEEVFDANKLAQKYCDEVANPMDMIVFRKECGTNKKSKSSTTNFSDDFDDIAQIFNYNDDEDWNKTVQGGIKKHFSSEENKDKLTVLSVNGLNEALNRFIDRGDVDAFKDIVSHQMNKTITYLETCNAETDSDIIKEIKNFRDRRMEREDEEQMEIQQFFNNPNKETHTNKDNVIDLSDSEEDAERNAKAKGTRGRGGNSRSRGSHSVSRGRKAKDTDEVTITRLSGGVPQVQKQKNQSTLKAVKRGSRKAAVENIVIEDSD